jgi:hypothetical protein
VDTEPLQVAFFDIGNTLGAVRLSPRPPHRLERLDVYPQVSDVLQDLRRSGVPLGIVFNIGQQTEEDVRRVLEVGHIYDFFEPDLLIYGAKDSPEIFRHAAEQAGSAATPERCLYVGEDRNERSFALEALFYEHLEQSGETWRVAGILAVLWKPLRNRIEASVSRLNDRLIGADRTSESLRRKEDSSVSSPSRSRDARCLVSLYRTYMGL